MITIEIGVIRTDVMLTERATAKDVGSMTEIQSHLIEPTRITEMVEILPTLCKMRDLADTHKVEHNGGF